MGKNTSNLNSMYRDTEVACMVFQPSGLFEIFNFLAFNARGRFWSPVSRSITSSGGRLG